MAVTSKNIQDAFDMGSARAQAEIEDHALEATDDVWDAIDRNDVIFVVTAGEKIDPDSESGWLIIDAYEDGYYDYWYEYEYEEESA